MHVILGIGRLVPALAQYRHSKPCAQLFTGCKASWMRRGALDPSAVLHSYRSVSCIADTANSLIASTLGKRHAVPLRQMSPKTVGDASLTGRHGLAASTLTFGYYYGFPILLKALSYVPGFDGVYDTLRRHRRRTVRLGRKKIDRLCGTIRVARRVCRPEETILDLGTGWYWKNAIALYLAGFRKLVLYDIQDNSTLTAIQSLAASFRYNLADFAAASDRTAAEIEEAISAIERAESRAALLERMGARFIVGEPLVVDFGPGPIKLIVSDCVLPHIRPRLIADELQWLATALGPGGHMYHIIGHDDHLMYGLPAGNVFKCFAFSDRVYRMWFENRFQYINRYTTKDYERLFAECGLTVVERVIMEKDLAQLRRVGTIHPAFAKVGEDELATRISSWLVTTG